VLRRLLRAVRDSRLAYATAPAVGVACIRLLVRTLRVQHRGREHPEGCWAQGERIIVTFWHGQLLMMPFVYPGRPAAILISQHRDGEYIARMAASLGFQVVRGSATRGGARAFRELMTALRGASNVALTPDGPKGPRRQVKSGVVELARRSGMPIVPVAFAAARARTLRRSWDQFFIPAPGSPAAYVWGEPIRVPANTDRRELLKYQERLAEELDALTAKAEAACASPPARRSR
jgi:hypothetical protein